MHCLLFGDSNPQSFSISSMLEQATSYPVLTRAYLIGLLCFYSKALYH